MTAARNRLGARCFERGLANSRSGANRRGEAPVRRKNPYVWGILGGGSYGSSWVSWRTPWQATCSLARRVLCEAVRHCTGLRRHRRARRRPGAVGTRRDCHRPDARHRRAARHRTDFDELQRVAGDLHFVDGVIAENGAVIHFPDSGRPLLWLRRCQSASWRNAPSRNSFVAGRCLVDADASEAPRLLDVIRTLELPLVLIFNRGPCDDSPTGREQGDRTARRAGDLRLSPRNAVAIGDAENDHELLRLAEVGVAVEWGSEALQAAADLVLTGTGPTAVGDICANDRCGRESTNALARPASPVAWVPGGRS